MDRSTQRKLLDTFTTALVHRDAHGMAALFDARQGRYVDPCRPGESVGLTAVEEHLGLLCQALGDAVISPLDTLLDNGSGCIRWMAQQGGGRLLAVDAVTWVRLGDGCVEEARSYFDASAFLPSSTGAGHEELGGEATREGALVKLRGEDSRRILFDLEHLRGRVVVILLASRAAQEDVQRQAQALGSRFGGNKDVLLVLLLDGSDVPRPLRPVARSAMATLRAQAVRRFKEGFETLGMPVPPEVEDMVWFLPDWTGELFAGVGVSLPLKAGVLLVVDRAGCLAGTFAGPGDEAAHAAAACAEKALQAAG